MASRKKAAAGNTMSLPEWAGYMGWASAGMAYQARDEGRLVMAPDGERVLAAESKARYLATADPAKAPVADRHAQGRAVGDEGDAPPAPRDNTADRIGNSFQTAKAVKERYLALEAKRAYEVNIGLLRDAREVEHLAVTAGAELRQRLENLAMTLAPMLAPMTDEVAIRTTLQDQFADCLGSATHHFRGLSTAASKP